MTDAPSKHKWHRYDDSYYQCDNCREPWHIGDPEPTRPCIPEKDR